MVFKRKVTAGVSVLLSVLAMAYGFMAVFILSNLERNRREELIDGPILVLAGHSLMAASVTGAALAVGFALWSNLAH